MKRLSLPDLGWSLILLCYACSFLFLLISGKIYDFLHPRMLVFVIGTVVILLIMAGNLIVNVIYGFSSPLLKKGFIIFILPLFLGYAGRNIDTGTALDQAGHEEMSEILNSDVVSKTYSDVDVRNLLQSDVIEIDDESYFKLQFILNENAELFSGKKINVMGFMYRGKEFSPDLFLLARNVMWWRAADAVLTGFLCEYPGAEELEPDTWAIVSGTLDVTSSYDETKMEHVKIPKIIVDRISYIDPPRNKYIFTR